MRCVCLTPLEAYAYFEDYREFLERLKLDATAQEIREKAFQSKVQIWGVKDEKLRGICVTEIVKTRSDLICHVIAACGSASTNDQHSLFDYIKAWAKEQGCARMRIQGRKGWLRWDRRFKQTGIVAEMNLTGSEEPPHLGC